MRGGPYAPEYVATGRWTPDEHALFLEGLRLYGREWKRIASMIPTRTVTQIRTHAQKHFAKETKTPGSESHTRSARVLSAESDQLASPALSAMSGPGDDIPHARLSGGAAFPHPGGGGGREDLHLVSSSGLPLVFGVPPAAGGNARARLGSSGSQGPPFHADGSTAAGYRARLGSSGSQSYADSSGGSGLLRIKMRRGSHSQSYASLTEAVDAPDYDGHPSRALAESDSAGDLESMALHDLALQDLSPREGGAGRFDAGVPSQRSGGGGGGSPTRQKRGSGGVAARRASGPGSKRSPLAKPMRGGIMSLPYAPLDGASNFPAAAAAAAAFSVGSAGGGRDPGAVKAASDESDVSQSVYGSTHSRVAAIFGPPAFYGSVTAEQGHSHSFAHGVFSERPSSALQQTSAALRQQGAQSAGGHSSSTSHGRDSPSLLGGPRASVLEGSGGAPLLGSGGIRRSLSSSDGLASRARMIGSGGALSALSGGGGAASQAYPSSRAHGSAGDLSRLLGGGGGAPLGLGDRRRSGAVSATHLLGADAPTFLLDDEHSSSAAASAAASSVGLNAAAAGSAAPPALPRVGSHEEHLFLAGSLPADALGGLVPPQPTPLQLLHQQQQMQLLALQQQQLMEHHQQQMQLLLQQQQIQRQQQEQRMRQQSASAATAIPLLLESQQHLRGPGGFFAALPSVTPALPAVSESTGANLQRVCTGDRTAMTGDAAGSETRWRSLSDSLSDTVGGAPAVLPADRLPEASTGDVLATDGAGSAASAKGALTMFLRPTSPGLTAPAQASSVEPAAAAAPFSDFDFGDFGMSDDVAPLGIAAFPAAARDARTSAAAGSSSWFSALASRPPADGRSGGAASVAPHEEGDGRTTDDLGGADGTLDYLGGARGSVTSVPADAGGAGAALVAPSNDGSVGVGDFER